MTLSDGLSTGTGTHGPFGVIGHTELSLLNDGYPSGKNDVSMIIIISLRELHVFSTEIMGTWGSGWLEIN